MSASSQSGGGAGEAHKPHHADDFIGTEGSLTLNKILEEAEKLRGSVDPLESEYHSHSRGNSTHALLGPSHGLDPEPLWQQLLQAEKREKLQHALEEQLANPEHTQYYRAPLLSVGNVIHRQTGPGRRGIPYALETITLVRRTADELVRCGRVAVELEGSGVARDARMMNVDPVEALDFLARSEAIQNAFGAWWSCLCPAASTSEHARKQQENELSPQEHRKERSQTANEEGYDESEESTAEEREPVELAYGPLTDLQLRGHITEVSYVAVMTSILELLTVLPGHLTPFEAARADWRRDARGRRTMNYETFFLPIFCLSCSFFPRRRGSWVDDEAVTHHVSFLRELFLHVFPLPPFTVATEEANNGSAANANAMVSLGEQVMRRTAEERIAIDEQLITSEQQPAKHHHHIQQRADSPARHAQHSTIATGTTPDPYFSYVRQHKGYTVVRHREGFVSDRPSPFQPSPPAGSLSPIHSTTPPQEESSRSPARTPRSPTASQSRTPATRSPAQPALVRSTTPSTPQPAGPPAPRANTPVPYKASQKPKGTYLLPDAATLAGQSKGRRERLEGKGKKNSRTKDLSLIGLGPKGRTAPSSFSRAPHARRGISDEAFHTFPELDHHTLIEDEDDDGAHREVDKEGTPEGEQQQHSTPSTVVDGKLVVSHVEPRKKRIPKKSHNKAPEDDHRKKQSATAVFSPGAGSKSASLRFYWNLQSRKLPPPTPVIGMRVARTPSPMGGPAPPVKPERTPTVIPGAVPSHVKFNESFASAPSTEANAAKNRVAKRNARFAELLERQRQETQSMIEASEHSLGGGGGTNDDPDHRETDPLVQRWMQNLEQKKDLVKITLTVMSKVTEGTVPGNGASATPGAPQPAKSFLFDSGLSFETLVASTDFAPEVLASHDWGLSLRKGFEHAENITSTGQLRSALHKLCGSECEERKLLATPSQRERRGGPVAVKCKHVAVRGFLSSVPKGTLGGGRSARLDALMREPTASIPFYPGELPVGAKGQFQQAYTQ